MVILGLLKEGPKHGYEVRKLVREVLGEYTPVASKSIYYPLRSLEKKGFLRKERKREGKRPEKFIYHLTKDGEKEFSRLLSRNLLLIERPYLNVDLSLYFLPYVDKKIAKHRLQNRLKRLKEVREWVEELKKSLEEKEKPFHLKAVTEHNLQIVKTEIEFTSRLVSLL